MSLVNLWKEEKSTVNCREILLVPPRLAPIPPVKINLDENTPPQRAVFTCRVLRGSSDSLSLEWLLTDGSPVQV